MRVVVADDSLLFREGLARLLTEIGFQVDLAADVDELLRCVRERQLNLAIVDIRMPPTYTTEGLDAALRLRALQPGIGVLVLSQYVETNHLMQLLHGGARGIGYLLKDRVSDLAEFGAAVRRVERGGSVVDPHVVAQLVNRRRTRSPLDALSEREREVLALMAEGRSNQAICERLSLGARTIETHVRNIFSKLELPATTDDHRRVMAVVTYLRSAS